MLLGQLAVRAPDLIRGRVSRHAQKLVEVGCLRHHLSLSRLMDDPFRIPAQFLHVFAGVLWIGGGFYTLFVQLPGLLAAPPAARGPVMAQLAPRQIFYLLRVAGPPLATGVLNLFASGRAQQLQDPLGSRWS